MERAGWIPAWVCTTPYQTGGRSGLPGGRCVIKLRSVAEVEDQPRGVGRVGRVIQL